jgi:3-hydroxyisobutyrate dehydrogenase
MRIGFIGLGHMGAPMATNLAKAGYEVWGFDVAGTSAEGAHPATSLQQAVTGSAAVITMLPNGKILREVCTQVLEFASKGALFADCSTVDIESARALHHACQTAGLLSIDAPVSGGITGAANGTLTFMVGADDEAFAAAAPLLAIMGQKSVHCGSGGAGQAAKICNNMLLGISMIGTCEAFALGQKLGLDLQRLFEVISTSSGSCWSVNTYCPVPGVGPKSPADNDYTPGFAAELMLKDLLLSQEAASMAGADTPLGQHAAHIYGQFVAEGGKGRDFSALLPILLNSLRGKFDA